MRHAAYIYGIFCVSVIVGFAAYFLSIFTLIGLDKWLHLSLTTGKVIVYFFVFLPVMIGLYYFIRSIKAYKDNGMPEGFKGWRYYLVITGFFAFVLGALPVLIMILNPTIVSMSGISLGLGITVSFFLTLPAMVGIKNYNS
jgi:hypothetical protein